MGIVGDVLGSVFGGGRNAIAETAEVFRVNAENQAQREANYNHAALRQFTAEFRENKNWFDSLIDGLNRLPRPFMALGVIALFVYAAVDPVQFRVLMLAIAQVPEPLWWLLGAVVSFYFGARHQSKGAEMARYAAQASAMATVATSTSVEADPDEPTSDNPILAEWSDSRN